MRQRTSFWRRQFNKGRTEPGKWVEVERQYTRSTALQVATDIRGGRRVAGIELGETWEAEAWNADGDDALQGVNWRICIRLSEVWGE